MAKIFISYRRDDSAYATGVIRDQLVRQLADCEVFFDVDSIPFGVDFRQHLEGCVSACDCLVAVIGKSWLSVVDQQGQRRLDNPHDAVRVEVETALRRRIPLIPVFLDGIPVPTPEALPESLRDLVGRNAIFVRPPPDFNHDVGKLVHAIQRWLDQQGGGEFQEATPKAESHEAASQNTASQQTASAEIASPEQVAAPRRQSARGRLFALAAVVVALVGGGWWMLQAPGGADGPPEYEIAESFLYEDDVREPAPWQARSRMLDGGFKLPIRYVHWVVVLTHAKSIQPTVIPVECRLVDPEGAMLVEFAGLKGDLPDSTYPRSGKTEWIFNFGSRETMWKLGKYTVQLTTPTKSANISFEVFPPAGD